METAHCPHLASADGPYPDWRATHHVVHADNSVESLMFVWLDDMLFGFAESDWRQEARSHDGPCAGGRMIRTSWLLLASGDVYRDGEPFAGTASAVGFDAAR